VGGRTGARSQTDHGPEKIQSIIDAATYQTQGNDPELPAYGSRQGANSTITASGRVTTSKPHRAESFKLSRDAKLRRAGAYKCINEALLTSLSSAPESSHGCHAGLIGAIA
jgi:hypothetical protein